MCYLALHAGSFVPDQQTFQSGAHSLAKRLLVMLFEDAALEVPIKREVPRGSNDHRDESDSESSDESDSSSSGSSSSSSGSDSSSESVHKRKEPLTSHTQQPVKQQRKTGPLPDMEDALSLAIGALWGQLDSTWRPTESLLLRWIHVAVRAIETPLYMIVPMTESIAALKSSPFTFARAFAAYDAGDVSASVQLTSALLNHLGSFEGDKALVHCVAEAARRGRCVRALAPVSVCYACAHLLVCVSACACACVHL